jgi:hypothetical protein
LSGARSNCASLKKKLLRCSSVQKGLWPRLLIGELLYRLPGRRGCSNSKAAIQTTKGATQAPRQ